MSRQKEARSRDYALILSKYCNVFHSVQYHRHPCILQAFDQLETLYIHSVGDNNPTLIGCDSNTALLIYASQPDLKYKSGSAKLVCIYCSHHVFDASGKKEDNIYKFYMIGAVISCARSLKLCVSARSFRL